MKKCYYKFTHNKSVVEIKFQTLPKKGYFKEHVEPLVTVLKATIPASFRTYKPDIFTWEITIEYWEPYSQLINAMGCNMQEVAEAKASNIPHVEVPKDYAENFYRNTASASKAESTESIAAKLSTYLGVEIKAQELSELKSLYRQKARLLHPDLGGDAAKMSELNRLWTLYCNTGVKN